jgi:predicted phosphodiesterase
MAWPMSADTFKVLLLPDVHVPYHCRRAWRVALDYIRRGRPGAIIQVGDFNSFDSVSRYKHDPRQVLSLEDEIAGGNEAMDELDAACRAGGVVRENRWLLEGNHEVRLDAYVLERAPELRPFIDWREMLKLDQRGWRTLPYLEALELGELSITHDIGRSGVNAARQSLLDYGHNLAFGHTHRAAVAYQGTVRGKRHVSATIGWLGDPELIHYRHRSLVRRDWQHAFAIVHFRANGAFWLQVIPIVDGAAVVDGEIYRG